MEYFGGSSSSKKSEDFHFTKKDIRIMAGAQPRTSCRSLFKQLEISPVPCLYILSLLNFISSNVEFFEQIHLYKILISIIFIDQIPTYLIFKKYILCWH